VTTSSRKSYNKNASQYDDMEYVQRYGLDPSLAYTPKINEAIEAAIKANTTTFKQRTLNDPQE